MTRGRRYQRGQAIVLIAIMLAVVVGMGALAIDGSRAYALRRDLQAAVDAGALAAGDNFQQTGSYASAEQAATTIFGANLRLYGSPSCSPSYASPGANPLTITCTFADGTVLTEVVSGVGAQGSDFRLTAARSLQLQFARILTNGSNPVINGAASGNVNNLLYTPTVAALAQSGCGGVGGSAISLSGGGAPRGRAAVVARRGVSGSAGATRGAGATFPPLPIKVFPCGTPPAGRLGGTAALDRPSRAGRRTAGAVQAASR